MTTEKTSFGSLQTREEEREEERIETSGVGAIAGMVVGGRTWISFLFGGHHYWRYLRGTFGESDRI
ncbi:MAG: hypothetical protein QMD22_10450 [archaeon]|nr:hypothetical protein [archaeon]